MFGVSMKTKTNSLVVLGYSAQTSWQTRQTPNHKARLVTQHEIPFLLSLPPAMLHSARNALFNCSVDRFSPLFLNTHARRSCCRLRAADERIEVAAAHVADATPHERRVQ